ncbi:hypothetical protein [Candidatus Nitronereus thalassa]|uniref:Uncharacterized protein n=1 Tax=Candidatus Nitronereus thalassa TaxID=3020898 RepID=A0ABU3K3P8_9BACT|nr:hypothetical protein [Candidatus Nitronereus thalassa]MDT7041037.1 hypothetical protein [Candidatus Nitronereus thalassa]
MPDQQEEKPKLPLTSMLALVAVVSGLLVSQIPLKTSRPIGKEADNLVLVGDDRVQSRLWQDPFEAVDDHLVKERQQAKENNVSHEGHHALEDLAHVIHRLAPENPSFLILPVMTDGNPYSKGVETRLRHRYALVSALGASEYLPEASQYVRFFRWKRQPCVKSSCAPLIVPVEWYKPKPSLGPMAPPVLILWLKGQDFSEKPLAGLTQLIKDLKKNFNQVEHQFRILGPRGSGGLSAMVKEADQFPDDYEILHNVEIFSSWATADDIFLIGDPPGESRILESQQPIIESVRSLPLAPGKVEKIFNKAHIPFYRTIGTDTMLAEQLVKELSLRNVNLTESCSDSQCPHHVALISEWDSLYGRVLPRTFVAVAQNQGSGKPSPQLDDHINTLRRDIWPTWAHHFSYLGGLDGELPPKDSDKGGKASSSKDKGGDNTSRLSRGLELPEGRGQLDYIRRLVKTLQDAEANIPGGFKAIGVLGSDVYDKLLILQAVRNSFPQAIFFTTDLDAQLIHPQQWSWTRNLVIASHFGLELRRHLQEPIPPFRDSYQTAFFFTVLQALKAKDKRKVITDVPPRVYEIGRHGPFDLSALDAPNAPPGLHPERTDLDPDTGHPSSMSVFTLLTIAGACALIFLCFMLLSSQVWTAFIGLVTSWSFWLTTVIAIAMAIGLDLWAMSDGAEGEPFVVTEGISVWPTQALRLLAFLLSGGFFIYAGWSLRNNEIQLRDKFPLPELSKDCPQGPWYSRFIGIHGWCPEVAKPRTIQQLWLDYMRLGRWDNRWLRYFLQSLLYLLFGGLLMLYFGPPHTPCRGPACFSINTMFLIFSVLGMVLLIFFVVDATRLCRRLIKHLVVGSIQWPKEFLEHEARKRGVDRTCVHEWLCIDFIAERTAVIGHLIYYPFVIVFLMAVARHPYFDHWDLPVGLAILIFLNIAYAFGNGVALRRSAEQARRVSLDQLNARLLPLNDQVPVEKESKRHIERAIEAIKHNRKGAFMPLAAHPIVGAIALPSGGYGFILLAEYLSTAF